MGHAGPRLAATAAAKRSLGYIVNDWQLSGILTGQLGHELRPRLQLPERRRQHEPDGLAGLRRAHRLRRAIRVRAAPTTSTRSSTSRRSRGRPTAASGLESGRNYHASAARTRWSTSRLARNIRLGGGRSCSSGWTRSTRSTRHLHDRQNQIQFNSPTDLTIRNAQFNADGTLVSTRLPAPERRLRRGDRGGPAPQLPGAHPLPVLERIATEAHAAWSTSPRDADHADEQKGRVGHNPTRPFSLSTVLKPCWGRAAPRRAD